MKKIISILLILSMMIFGFAGCGNNNSSSEKPEGNESNLENSADESMDENDDYNVNSENISYDELEKRNLKGREIYIIERWFGYGKLTVDFTGEVLYMENDDEPLTEVNAAKKEIIEKVQKDYNCKIKGEIFGDGHSDIVGDLKTQIATDIESGTNLYDFFFESPYYYGDFIYNDHLKDVRTLSTINLNSSCWDQNAVRDLSVCNSLYFILGDINTHDNACTVAMLFNKDLYKKLGYTEDLYQLVKDKKWTFDKLEELSTSYTLVDKNKDGLRNSSDDWFMISPTTNLYHHVVGAGERICTKDSNDELKLSMKNDKAISALADAVAFYDGKMVYVEDVKDYDQKYGYGIDDYIKTSTNIFLEGSGLFYMTSLDKVSYFRQMDDEFGILPVPMYSDSQDNYYSSVYLPSSSALMIPSNANADDDLGAVIQAFAELSEEKLTAKYYDKILNSEKYNDVESAEMLDIIFGNRHYDFGIVFGQQFGNPDELYRTLDTNIESRFEEKEEELATLVEETVKDIKNSQRWQQRKTNP